METLEGIKEFFYLLDVSPLWGLLILILLVISCITPWQLEQKIEETEDKDTGKKVYKIFRLRNK